ncbi:heme-binding protein 2-like [Paralichthys olivaceus]|uniref:heme-binding protein 2-like n=1 Tax=Paralichthys olivaceus TaxID=8255 RepID=UPI003752DAB7
MQRSSFQVKQSAKMMLLSGLVGLLLVLTAEARVGNSSGSELCSVTEPCALFDLICQTEDFEVRHYESVTNVVTDETAFSIDIALVNGFKRLEKYFNGANENGAKIDMIEQIGILVPHGNTLETTYNVFMALPAEYQETPPTPTGEHVYIINAPEVDVYVQGYDGLINDKSDNDAAQSLASDLDSVGANYDKTYHFALTYISPLSITNRHSEVLFVALGEPVCN